MILNEIRFEIQTNVKWGEPYDNKYLGEFQLGSSAYQIDVNLVSFDVSGGTLKIADIAFRRDGKSELSKNDIPFKVFGSIINALKVQLPKLAPDVITFGVLKEDGSVEARKSVYSKLSFIASKTLGFEQLSRWIDIGLGFYGYMVKKNSKFNQQDIQELENWISSLNNKF